MHSCLTLLTDGLQGIRTLHYVQLGIAINIPCMLLLIVEGTIYLYYIVFTWYLLACGCKRWVTKILVIPRTLAVLIANIVTVHIKAYDFSHDFWLT